MPFLPSVVIMFNMLIHSKLDIKLQQNNKKTRQAIVECCGVILINYAKMRNANLYN